MYGNLPSQDNSTSVELTSEERKHLRAELSSVANRTRELLPSEFVVGSEIVEGSNGPRATVAVQPPVGSMVSADYTPDGKIDIADTEQEDIAVGLAASAALQVKSMVGNDHTPTAR